MSGRPVIPYLTISGAAEAIAFYEKAFGAVERTRMPTEDGKHILHAHLSINGGDVFLSEDLPDICGSDGPIAPVDGRVPPVAMVLDFASPKDVDETYARALGFGAKGVMEPADQFWGARFAVLADPFGHRWMLNATLPAA